MFIDYFGYIFFCRVRFFYKASFRWLNTVCRCSSSEFDESSLYK